MTLAIVQARLGSMRFPSKVMADLHGLPMVMHVVGRARQIRGVDLVALAVPAGEALLLAHWFAAHAPDVPENDVLARFAAVAERYANVDVICRLTGDCPLLQPDICARLLTNWRASGCEYGWLDTHSGVWPDGLDCEVFTRDLLMRADEQATEPADREHVTSIMRRIASVYSLPSDPHYADWPKLSVDTPEDLERVRAWSAKWRHIL